MMKSAHSTASVFMFIGSVLSFLLAVALESFGFFLVSVVIFAGSFISYRKAHPVKKKATKPNGPRGADSEPLATPSTQSSFLELCEAILEDCEVDLEEAQTLQRFFMQNPPTRSEPLLLELKACVNEALLDGELDSDEEAELFTLLSEYCDSFGELAEAEKALKLTRKAPPHFVGDIPPPPIPEDSGEDDEPLFDIMTPDTHYALHYEAANGSVSEREIIFKRAYKKGGRQYMEAICLKRNALRTFRGDRVLGLFDLHTGEVLA
ncbi:MAG: hypothetical protein ACQES2_04885 [Pseudomonadota bacterium]